MSALCYPEGNSVGCMTVSRGSVPKLNIDDTCEVLLWASTEVSRVVGVSACAYDLEVSVEIVCSHLGCGDSASREEVPDVTDGVDVSAAAIERKVPRSLDPVCTVVVSKYKVTPDGCNTHDLCVAEVVGTVHHGTGCGCLA